MRTRDILRWEGIDAHSLMYLEYEDYVNLDLRMGARAKLRRWAASQRREPVPDWLKCPLSSELFDDPVLLIVDSRTCERPGSRIEAPARPTDLARRGGRRVALHARMRRRVWDARTIYEPGGAGGGGRREGSSGRTPSPSSVVILDWVFGLGRGTAVPLLTACRRPLRRSG